MINISPSNQITKIYLVTNCYGDPNKIYIGKTKNCRKNPHRRKYGKNITYDYIDEVHSLDRKIWTPIESFWIEYFRQLGFDIQNPNKKGGGGPEYYSEEIKKKISTNNIGKRCKKVLQYNLNGDFIKEWKSITDIQNNLLIKDISLCCNKKIQTAGGFIFRFKNNPLEENYIIPHKKRGRAIIQYDLKNNFIKKWDRIKDASISFNIKQGDICSCCLLNQKTAGGYIWRYENNPLDPLFKIPKYNSCKPILQYDLEGNFIQEWYGGIEIYNILGYNPGNISACCNNKQKTYKKFIWKFKNI